jgi:transcriptional regulator with XRE-family HTH domain
MTTFGERFKQLRLIKNYTQEELVNDFNKKYHYNLGKSAISQYENDKRIPEINVLINFANYFDVSIDFLLCRKSYGNSTIEEEAENYILPKSNEKLELTNLPKQFDDMLNYYKNIYFNGKPASKKVIKLIKNCIRISVELSKEENEK